MTKRISRRALVVWTGLTVLFVAFLLAGLTVRHGFSARDDPTALETFVARSARAMAVPSSAKGMKNPFPDSAEAIAEGRAHWADHCATCHGNNGSGKTEIGQSLYPKAPDMRLERTQRMTDGELYYTIQNGIRLTGMPAWGNTTDHDEASWKLVRFIRHLPQLTTEEEQEMERLNPKGPDDRNEEQDEEQFLEGKDPTAMRHQGHHMNPQEKK